jgi:hypothetical protein
MELNNKAMGSSKGQLMTLVMLIILVLLVAELFAFALLNISSNSIGQSLTLTSSFAGYSNLLTLSADSFASSSLSRAITTLANYESTPAYRKGNFITNTSLYLSDLVANGVLPNDTSGYPQNAMGNLTLRLYNLSVANVIGVAAQSVRVNESQPLVFQTDPYHIRMAYIERIAVNSSGSSFRYTIPVNVSLPLNGTPDLFYSQQGLSRQIRFASLANITSVVGGMQAASGNTLAYAYGTVYWLQSNSISGAACSSIPASISAASVSGNIILATYNAIGLEGCENSYAGLITYIAPTTLPTVAYLVYPSSSNFLQLIPSGTTVLIWGPLLETLNIEGLRSAISNGYYFASPFAPSYLDRAQANFLKQSPNGIFKFSNYDREALSLAGGSNQYVQSTDTGLPSGSNARSMFAWVKTSNTAGQTIISYGTAASTELSAMFINWNQANELSWDIDGYNCQISVDLTNNAWHFVGITYSGGAIASGTSPNVVIYADGTGTVATCTASVTPNTVLSGSSYIGVYQTSGGGPFTGQISNAQIYSKVLAPSQVEELYQEGISGIPLSNSGLVGWWPLNGNANDYSGGNNNGILKNGVTFGLLQNYSRDSILNTPVPTKLSPLPGILSCTSNSNCASNTLPQLYLGYMPLEVQNRYMQTARFDGSTSYITMGNPSNLNLGSAVSVSAWIYETVAPTDYPQVAGRVNTGGVDQYGLRVDPDNHIAFWGYNGFINTPAESPSAIGLKNWTFATGTYDGSSLRLYVNNALVSTTSLLGPLTLTGTIVFNIGFDPEASTRHFAGNISNVQVYSSALSTNQVLQLYKEGVTGIPLLSSNLVGWWPLNGNANDYSGNGNNGVAASVVYPYFSGSYSSPGLSTIAATANEWQALGLANT